MRAPGTTLVLRYTAIRQEDGKRVESTVAVGLVSKYPSEAAAWAEVNHLHLHEQINKEQDFKGAVTFGDLARYYEARELATKPTRWTPKSHTTVAEYKRNLSLHILPKWGKRIALGIEPSEIEVWLKTLKREQRLENPTLDRQRRIMSLVYKSTQRYGLIGLINILSPLSQKLKPFENNGAVCRHCNARTYI